MCGIMLREMGYRKVVGIIYIERYLHLTKWKKYGIIHPSRTIQNECIKVGGERRENMSEYKERKNMDSMSELWTHTYDRTENSN